MFSALAQETKHYYTITNRTPFRIINTYITEDFEHHSSGEILPYTTSKEITFTSDGNSYPYAFFVFPYNKAVSLKIIENYIPDDKDYDINYVLLIDEFGILKIAAYVSDHSGKHPRPFKRIAWDYKDFFGTLSKKQLKHYLFKELKEKEETEPSQVLPPYAQAALKVIKA